MSFQNLLGALTALAMLAAAQGSADAQYYSGSYTTYYSPYSSYYNGGYTSYYTGGYTSYYGGGFTGGGNCCGTGYTSYYGGSYGGNPFAPLVPSPYGYGWFGSGYTAAYGPVGYGGGCCSPCATGCGYGCSTGGCATGNCSVPASTEQMKPTPDNGVPMEEPMDDEPPRTYLDEDEEPPMDSPGFRPSGSGTEEPEGDEFPGGFEANESFKISPMNREGLEGPEVGPGPADPESPLDADKPNVEEEGSSVPGVQLYGPTNKPITPRNSAQVRPVTELDHRITWRSKPVIVPERQQLTASRPLVVRKTVKVQLNDAPTLVSQSAR